MIRKKSSIRLGEEGTLSRDLAADEASAGRAALSQRNRAAGRARLLANPGLARGAPAPVDLGHPAAAFAFHLRAKLRVVVELAGVGAHRVARLRLEALLHVVNHRPPTRRKPVDQRDASAFLS